MIDDDEGPLAARLLRQALSNERKARAEAKKQALGIPAVIEALRKNVIHGDGRLYNPAGHNPLMARSADIMEELYEECFRLAANQCKAGYSGEHGDHMCRYVDDLRKSESICTALLEALKQCKTGAEYPDELGDTIDAALSRASHHTRRGK